MKSRKIIELNNVSWWADNKEILHGIDWSINKGEHWAILGLNGSGKTSLVRMLNAYVTPSSGTMTVLGEAYGRHDWREMRKRMGLVSSSLTDNLYATETALEITLSGLFATMGLYDNATESQKDRARAVLTSIGAGRLANEPYMTLSQGERQRVLIARALIGEPEILILDEPCEGLDVIARETLLDALGSMAQADDHLTIIIITHRPEEILPLFTHALLMKDGVIFSKGAVKKVINSHNLSRFLGRDTEVLWKNGRPWVTF